MSALTRGAEQKETRPKPKSKPRQSSRNTRERVGGGPRHTTTNKNKMVRKDSKLAKLIALLKGTGGATITELSKATRWQAHSVRGVMSGVIKKKRGLKITSVRSDGVRTYRIVE